MSAGRVTSVLLGAALVVAAPAGCGETVQTREPDVRLGAVEAPPPPTPIPRTPNSRSGERRDDPSRLKSGRLRIAVVTHGQASDPFWSVVNAGLEQAARELNVAITYSAPDTTDMGRMRELIREALASRPDGLIVSIPDANALGGTIRAAVRSGLPVASINSGTAAAPRLGVLVHVGQPDRRAGEAAGRRMARSGVRRGLCIEHERGNAGLRQRCAGFTSALRGAGGRARVVQVNQQDAGAAERRIVDAVRDQGADGVLALGPGGARPALEGLRKAYLTTQVKIATFDLSPDVLEGLDAFRIAFAVDQQPFQQGYLPVMFLAQRIRYGLQPPGRLAPTGPSFVTRRDLDDLRRLTTRGIR